GTDGQADAVFPVSTCVFVPPPQTGTILVTKVVVGGNDAPSAFTLNAAGANASPASFPGSAGQTQVTVGAGQYSITEPSHTNYDVSFSADCSGTMAVGQTKLCTVTNTYNPPQLGNLTVHKVAVGGDAAFSMNGGTLGDFTITTIAGAGDHLFSSIAVGLY